MATAGTIASRAYAPKPGAPALPAIVRKACQQLAGGKNNTGETLLTQNRKHYQTGEPFSGFDRLPRSRLFHGASCWFSR